MHPRVQLASGSMSAVEGCLTTSSGRPPSPVTQAVESSFRKMAQGVTGSIDAASVSLKESLDEVHQHLLRDFGDTERQMVEQLEVSYRRLILASDTLHHPVRVELDIKFAGKKTAATSPRDIQSEYSLDIDVSLIKPSRLAAPNIDSDCLLECRHENASEMACGT